MECRDSLCFVIILLLPSIDGSLGDNSSRLSKRLPIDYYQHVSVPELWFQDTKKSKQ